MKRTVLLYTFTAVLIGTIVLTGNAVMRSYTQVKAVKLGAHTVENTVICSGKIETADETKGYSDYSGVAENVFVKQGESVKKDQPIMRIRRTTESSTSSAASSSIEVPTDYDQYQSYYQQYLNSGRSLNSGGNTGVLPSSSASSSSATGGDYLLLAPDSGIIESIAATKPGEYVLCTSPAVVIRGDENMRVRLSVDESQISNIKKGQKVQISGVGFQNTSYAGTVESIASEAKQQITGTTQETVVEVLANVIHPGMDVLPGFNAKAKITTSQDNHALVVPYEAVREDDNEKEYVFVVQNGRAVRKEFITAKELDDGFLVKSGLRENDLVITNPDDVTDGAKIVLTAVEKDGKK